LEDLFDKEIEVPSLYDIVKSFFTRKKLKVKLKAYPGNIIRKLEIVQNEVDKEIKGELEKAKRDVG